MLRIRGFALIVAVAASALTPALAQDFPSKPIKFIDRKSVV